MPSFVRFPLALAAVLSLSLTACGGGDDKSAAPSTPAASTSAPTVTPAVTKTPSGTVKRTSAELAKALLELVDMPDGYQLEKDDPADAEFGTKPFAFRLTATSGSRRGLELTAATTGVEDVIVSVNLLAGQDGELEGATEAAVSKAQQVLKQGA